MDNIFAQMGEPLSDGTWINSRIARIVEIIQDYDPALEVKWLPRDARVEGADVFQIVDTRINMVAFSVKDEASFDETVLARIFESDMERQAGGPITVLQKIDAHNAAIKALQLKQRIDENNERNEKIATILRSPLNAYKHDGFRWDLPADQQPKVGIFDVGISNKTKS